jgi:hypothetical protein
MSVQHNLPAASSGASPPARSSGGYGGVLIAVIVGSAISISLGVYGKVHKPTGFSYTLAGFSGQIYVKVWLATVMLAFAFVQVGSALVMYGKVPKVTAPSWIAPVHRWSGRLAVITSVPIAVACLYALGFQDYQTRVLLHSILGCFFYGVFTAKMLLLSRPNAPGWAVPVLGGLVFTTIVALWVTAALWFFTHVGVQL